MDTLPLPIGAVKQAQRPTTIRPAPTPPVQALNPVTLPSPPSPAPLAPLSRGAVTAIGLGVAADGALTLVLLATGWTQGGAHIAGWLAGLMLWLLLAAWAGRGGPAGVLPWTARIGWRGVLAVLALGLRGGVLASALAWGLPAPAAALLGLAAAWAVLIVGERRGLAHIAALPAARRAPAAAGALALAMVLLHLAYLKVFPLLPEEAYYWNYAARPAPGYLDHPPMVAWLIAAAEALAGHGEAVVRLPALLCGAVTAGFVWALARRLVDPAAAGVAAALALALPYAFFLGGLLITPDAPLAASWAAALYFLHRALVSLDARAWVGVGVALGVGMLSKYTIALLGPAALLFCLADARARAWFRRPQPYAAVLLAALLFAPVVWWNHTHDWASFRFQGGERFVEPARFQLHVLLLNVLLVATPLPLLALPLLWTRRWSAASAADSEPAHAEPRNRWFVACFVAVPLAVFAWSALRHEPRLNWTGPIWLATLPMLGWAIVHARMLARPWLGNALRRTVGPIIGLLLVVYSVAGYHLVLGVPGLPYTGAFARFMGWQQAGAELQALQARVQRETGQTPVVVGLDKYNTASQIGFYGAPPFVPPGQPALKATSLAAFSGNALMYGFWDPPQSLAGRPMILVARERADLADERLAPHFGTLESEIRPLVLGNTGPGGNRRAIDTYYVRIGLGFKP